MVYLRGLLVKEANSLQLTFGKLSVASWKLRTTTQQYNIPKPMENLNDLTQ